MSQTFQRCSTQTCCSFGGVRPDCSLSSDLWLFPPGFGHDAQLTRGQLQEFNFAVLLPCGCICWPLIGPPCHSDCPPPPAGRTTCPLARHQAAKPPSDQTTPIRSELESNDHRSLRVSWCHVFWVCNRSSSMLSQLVSESVFRSRHSAYIAVKFCSDRTKGHRARKEKRK